MFYRRTNSGECMTQVGISKVASGSSLEGQQPHWQSPAARKPRLLEQLRQALRSRHYSRRTEQTYCQWVKRFIYFHEVRHPAEMAEPEINAFLTHLAVKDQVSASTQNQALSALLFLYRHVLNRKIGDLGEVIRARKPKRLPVVVTREEAKLVLSHLKGDRWLMASLMYGAGLRHGVFAAAGPGHRLRCEPDCRPRWERL